MTTAQVKQYLGIPTATTTYDSDIAIYTPIVEATARQITGGLYLLQVNGSIVTGSNLFTVGTIYSQIRQLYGISNASGEGYPYNDPGAKLKPLNQCLQIGMQITGDGIPAGAFISGFTRDGEITLSANATKTQDVEAYTDYPINYLGTIAHGVYWMIGQQKLAINDTEWTHRTVGPLSVTRSNSDMKIDGQYGMPVWFVKAFPRVYK